MVVNALEVKAMVRLVDPHPLPHGRGDKNGERFKNKTLLSSTLSLEGEGEGQQVQTFAAINLLRTQHIDQ